MPHHPKPFFRSARDAWFLQLNGKQINLGPDRNAAFLRYHELMAAPPEVPTPALGSQVIPLIDAFLDWCQCNRAPRSYDWYKERTQSFVSSIPPALAISQLKPFHVQQWVDAKPNWSDGHRRGAMIAVQRALNWAVQMGHIDKSPIAHIEKPKAGKRDIVLSPDQYQDIVKRFDDCFRDLLTLAWESGARPQELFALEARHVDTPNHRMVFMEKEAKGKKRIRVVYLNDAAMAIVSRLMPTYPEGKLLRNEDGHAWSRHAVSCRFERLKKKIGRKLCLYNFRHSFCHKALKRGVDPITLANLMGHVDTAMIARVYSNLSQDTEHLMASLRKATG